jgi:hypothetical protein
MPHVRSLARRGALGLAGLAAAAAPVFALAPGEIGALSKLEHGRWQMRDTQARTGRSVCLGDPAIFLQLEHRGLDCGREILASEANSATVQYTCPGRGFAHTSIRVETPRLARIDTQGLIDGRPFSYRIEASKVGSC